MGLTALLPPALVRAWVDQVPYWARDQKPGNHLWNLVDDPDEERDLAGSPLEKDVEEQLRAALLEVSAPDDQLVRLGLE